MQEIINQYISAKRALFDKVYGKRLNPEQLRAVFTVDGPLLVLAGAGSGKTTVLVNRIAYLIKYGKAKRDIIKDAWLDTTYGYQIFDGKKKPRRDKILQLAFGFPLSVEDTNILLRAGGMNSLYIRSKRDAICMYCLQQHTTSDECNEMLYKAGEETF